jgi:hypothetical protein
VILVTRGTPRDLRAPVGSASPSSPEQQAFIGKRAGGRVRLVLRTDDFGRADEPARARPFELPARRIRMRSYFAFLA